MGCAASAIGASAILPISRRCAARAGALGAAAIGVNPLHALFAAEPRHFSPYSPSSRVWLELPLYRCDRRARVCRGTKRRRPLAPGGGESRRRAPPSWSITRGGRRASGRCSKRCSSAFAAPTSAIAAGRSPTDFAQFPRQRAGRRCADFAIFEALHEHFLRAGGEFSWHSWPARDAQPALGRGRRIRPSARRAASSSFSSCNGKPTASSARGGSGRRSGPRDRALSRLRGRGRSERRRGLGRSTSWSSPGASIGAPPDPLSRAGQNWGLAPLNPLALRRRGFAPLIAALRANMRHAGVLRIDHVMGLRRLYWVPSGAPATPGAYVELSVRGAAAARRARKPATPLRRHRRGSRHRAGGFRETMRAANVLSYRVLVFERHADGSFVPPGEYPPLAAASAATHDLATLKGFWLGRDIEWRRRARPLSRRRGRSGRGRGAPPRPAAAARSSGPRGAARARAVRRLSVG